MYHAPSRNVRLLKKIGFLFLTWIVVVGGVVLLTALTLGYSFNREKGHVERSGILQIGSRPGGATVILNDRPLGTRTPAKVVSVPGDYALQIDAPGYKTWQKTVPIRAGGLTWATYPRLVPEKLTTKSVVNFSSQLADALPSPGSTYYAFIPKADQPQIDFVTLSGDTPKHVEAFIPKELYSHEDTAGVASAFSIESWSADEDALLVRHAYGSEGATEWLLVNRTQPEASINLSRLFGVSMSDITLANGNGSRFYAIVDGSVRLFNVSNETIGRPLVEGVADYRLFDDEYVLFVTAPTEQQTQQVGYMRHNFEKPRVIEAVPYDGINSALADVGKYYDKYYFLISHGATATLSQSSSLAGDNSAPLKRKLVTTMKLDQPITTLHIAGNGQFAIAQDGTSFTTHNLEISQTTRTQLLDSSDKVPQKLRHLESQLLWADHGGKLRTYEFDGANQHDIMPAEPRFGATFSPQGKYLYAVHKTDDGYSLSRVQFLDLANRR
jgi:hypothetical protein